MVQEVSNEILVKGGNESYLGGSYGLPSNPSYSASHYNYTPKKQ